MNVTPFMYGKVDHCGIKIQRKYIFFPIYYLLSIVNLVTVIAKIKSIKRFRYRQEKRLDHGNC